MELSRHWARTGAVKQDFLLTSGETDFFDEEAKRLGAQLHYCRYGRRTLPQFSRAFRQLLREHRYDAIHDHADYASGWHFALGLGRLPPVRVAHVHNPRLHIDANYAVSPSRRLATVAGQRLTSRLATHICGTSAQALREYGFPLGGRVGPKVAVVHCGIDVDKFSGPRKQARNDLLTEFGWPEETRVVLFAGRLDGAFEFFHPQNHKNSWFALHVARETIRLDSRARFVFAGSGERLTDLRSTVAEWGMAEEIRLVGVREDIDLLMKGSDALLFPSAQEGLGMVAVEAQAVGLPVVASTAVPEEAIVIPEIYESVSLHDPLTDWVCALIRALSKPRISAEVARTALANSGFSIERSARGLESVYRRAVRQ